MLVVVLMWVEMVDRLWVALAHLNILYDEVVKCYWPSCADLSNFTSNQLLPNLALSVVN